MKTFFEYLLSEIDLPGGSPLGATLGGAPPAGGPGIASPATGPAGLGAGGPPPAGGPGGGMPPMSGGGAAPGMDPSMGGGSPAAPGGQMQPPTKYKTSNVWDVLERILDGKKIGVEKDKNAGTVPANGVSSGQLPQNNIQQPPTQPEQQPITPPPPAPGVPGQLPAVPGSSPPIQ